MMPVFILGMTEPVYALQTLHLSPHPPPESMLVLELSQQSQLEQRMFDWEKCSFIEQQKVRIKLAAQKFLRSGALMGKMTATSFRIANPVIV